MLFHGYLGQQFVYMSHRSYTFHSTLVQLPTLAETLINYAGKRRVWLLDGAIGAGKTTLIKSLCAQLGVRDHVTSPTFSVVHEYATASGEAVYHFDFYRIRHEVEAVDLDCITYFESGNYCFIEWPQKIRGLIPSTYCKIHLIVQPNRDRILHMSLV